MQFICIKIDLLCQSSCFEVPKPTKLNISINSRAHTVEVATDKPGKRPALLSQPKMLITASKPTLSLIEKLESIPVFFFQLHSNNVLPHESPLYDHCCTHGFTRKT